MTKLTVLISLACTLLGFTGGYAVRANGMLAASPKEDGPPVCRVEPEQLEGVLADIADLRTAVTEAAGSTRRTIREALAEVPEDMFEIGQRPTSMADRIETAPDEGAAPSSTEKQVYLDEAYTLIQSALQAGEWDDEDQEQLTLVSTHLSTEETVDLFRALSRAINNGQVVPISSLL